MNINIYGGDVLAIGDLHISDVFKGRHKDYLSNCFETLSILDSRIQEIKPKAIVLLGDLVGYTENNLRNRQVLSWICKIIMNWASICHVYSVKGNHDIEGFSDFQFLVELGLLRTFEGGFKYFDYYGYEGQEIPEVRFHLVDYGKEDLPLELAPEGASNIVFGHNDYQIQGVTTWYVTKGGVELARHTNFIGVDYVISGHIHDPSPEVYTVLMGGGSECSLFYAGCPTRPTKTKSIYESVWIPRFKYNPEMKSTGIDMMPFPLRPSEEIFYAEEDFIEEYGETEVQEKLRLQQLREVLDDLLKYRVTGGDPVAQVLALPNASEAAKEVAVKYLREAFL